GDSGSWFNVDLENLSASALGYERMAVTPEKVGKISTITYQAGDGLEIEAILTLPPGKDPTNLPLVVFPHGGPTGQDDAVFDWWAQAVAYRGYAVLQPNFRGSTNRDRAFIRAGYGEWGRKMQTDLSDGIAHLAAEGIVDPSRACIMGASYGGYAALAGVTLQQGIYRCAVSFAGVSDLTRLTRTEIRESGSNSMVKRVLKEEIGQGRELKDISPRRFADRADAPVLLIHGKDDVVVPFEQSFIMADALKDAGKPYELISLEGEDHWLSRSETRVETLRAAIKFLEEHNPPG
ncbi:MAG: S9 family peptidase, partial [Pseudomonadota bacterium]